MKKSIFKSILSLALALILAIFPIASIKADASDYVMRRQTDYPWNTVYVNGGSLAATGCGMFSFVNAVGYLTGETLDVEAVARWAHSIGSFNVTYGGDGTYRTSFYPRASEKYGPIYGFTIDCYPEDDNTGYWSSVNNSKLKAHLANGGTAVAHVYNHFIALVDYDYDTNCFRVWDCAPASHRGTNSNGGDLWLSQSYLTSATYMTIDWFCLLSLTTSHKLDGQDYVDMGKDFYARIGNNNIGKYFTDENNEVWARDFTGEANQVWHFMRQANGAYLVGNSGSSKFLSVKDAKYENGSRLVTSSVDYGAHQKFYIYYLYNNFYMMPEGRDMTVDIDCSLFHTQICGTETGNGKDEASFKARSLNLEIINVYDGTREISNLGDSFQATIKNSASGKYVTADGASLVAADKNNADTQKWNFTRLPNGSYTIVSQSENLAIDVEHTRLEEGTAVDMYNLTKLNAQTFFLIEKDGSYYIKPTYTLNTLHMNASTLDFAIYATSDDADKIAAQKFEISIIGGENNSLVLKDNSSYEKGESNLNKVAAGQTAAGLLSNFANENAVVYNANGDEVSGNAKVGTGYTVSLVVDGKKVDTLTIVILGDVTGDGIVDGTDYLKIKSSILGGDALTGAYDTAADVDGNNEVESTDYLRVKAHFLGSYNLFE